APPTRPHRRPPLRHVSPPCSSTKRPTITKIETETPAPLSGPIDRVEELFDAGDVARGIDSRKGDILEDLDADSETEPQGAQLLESLFALHLTGRLGAQAMQGGDTVTVQPDVTERLARQF